MGVSDARACSGVLVDFLTVTVLVSQDDKHYGKGEMDSDLPDVLRRRHDRLARICQARKEMEADTAALTARQRQEESEEARAQAAAARESDAQAAHQAELTRKAETAEAKAKAARPVGTLS